jgi:hypothetical protein
VFKEDDRKKLVIIQPSDKLINLLEEKMKWYYMNSTY